MSINSDLDDVKLVESFKGGDKSSFDVLVVKYQNKVINLCFRFLGNYDDACDCAQDVFVKVFESLSKFRGDSKFSTWLYAVTVNFCRNRISSFKHRKSKQDTSYEIQDAGDESLSPSKRFERKELNDKIQKAIDSLDEDQKSVVILRDIEGLSYEEIVDITGIKLGTVKSRIARAREELKEKLKGLI